MAPSSAPPPATKAARPGRRRALVVLRVAVVVGLVALAVAVLGDRWDEVRAAGGLPGIAPSSVALACSLAANVVLATSWRRLLRLAGADIGRGEVVRAWSTGQLARYGLAMAQLPGRAIAIRRHGVKASTAAATTGLELLLSLSMVSALALLTAPVWFGDVDGLGWAAVLAVGPLAALVSFVVAPAGFVRLAGRALRVPPLVWLRRGKPPGDPLPPPTRFEAAGLVGRYALNSGLRLVGFIVLFAALGGSVPGEVGVAVGAYALGHLVGLVSFFAPGGLGPREGVTAALVAPVIGLGPAVLLAAAVRVLEVAAELVLLVVVRIGRVGA